MANDRETKSFEVKPERPQETSAAIRAGGSDMLTGPGETMAGGKDADLRPHREAGSSGTGLPPLPDNDMRINSRDEARASGSGEESGGGSRLAGSSPGTGPSQDIGADDDGRPQPRR